MNSLQTQAGLKSVMKTANKAQRVPADINEDSPTPVRVLRNGKRVPRATPRLPRASRVELSPEQPKTLPRAHRVPVCQVSSFCLLCNATENPFCGAVQSFSEYPHAIQAPDEWDLSGLLHRVRHSGSCVANFANMTCDHRLWIDLSNVCRR